MEKRNGFAYELDSQGTLIIYSKDEIISTAEKCSDLSTEQVKGFVDDILKSMNLLSRYQHLFDN